MDQIATALASLLGVITVGVVGGGLTFWWNVLLKRREIDLVAARAFHEGYGEFFAVWKLWNYYVRDVGPNAFPDASRWKLLERACACESRIEATFIALTSRRSLSQTDLEQLGQFRQVYQQLRESIRDNRPLEWDWSEHDAYLAFKTLAPRVAQIIEGKRPAPEARAWLEVTSNKFEDFWKERKHQARLTSK